MRFRWSLRQQFVLVSLACTAIACAARITSEYLRWRTSLQALSEAHAIVEIESHYVSEWLPSLTYPRYVASVEFLHVAQPEFDNAIEALKHCRSLKSLRFGTSSEHLSNSHFACIAECRSLEIIDISGAATGDSDGVTDECSVYFSNLRQLREVYAKDTNVGDGLIIACASLPKLETIDVQATKVSGEGIAALCQQATSLQYLDISYNDLSVESIRRLSDLHSLRRLRARSCGATDGCMAAWGKGFDNLEFADLSYNDIEGPGLEGLTNATKLNTLAMRGTRFSKRGAQALARLRSLVAVDLSECPNDGTWWRYIGQLPKLQVLSVADAGVTDDVFERFSDGIWPSLQCLDLTANPVLGRSLPVLANCGALSQLFLGNTRVEEVHCRNVLQSHRFSLVSVPLSLKPALSSWCRENGFASVVVFGSDDAPPFEFLAEKIGERPVVRQNDVPPKNE